MRRILLGIIVGALIGAGTVGAAATGDQTVKGNLTVNGSAAIGGDTFTRSVQASGSPVISNFQEAFAEHLGAARVTINAGGNGFGWLDTSGTEVTRIVASESADPNLNPAPASSLLIQRNPARLWFRTDAGWTCVAGC